MPVDSTLQRILEFLLDCQQKYNQLSQQLRQNLVVHKSIGYYLEMPPEEYSRTASQQLLFEGESLLHLIADSKKVLIEFIPIYYKSIAVMVYGKIYYVSKVPATGSDKANLVVRAEN